MSLYVEFFVSPFYSFACLWAPLIVIHGLSAPLAVEENSIEFVIVNRTAEPSLEILMTTPNSLKPSRHCFKFVFYFG